MKGKIQLVVGILAISAASAYAYTAPGGGILGSKHDINEYAKLNPGVTVDAQGRLCAYCHTPHHAIDPNTSTADYLPLWSHTLTTNTYQEYGSLTLDADNSDTLYGPSRLCMSCHDGVIAIDTHYSAGNLVNNGTKVLTGDDYGEYAVGENGSLQNDHPVGFVYADVVDAAKGINPASTEFLDNPKNVTIQDALYDGYMTCATCHDVHNSDNTNGTASANYFVYAEQKDSKLCRTCHAK